MKLNFKKPFIIAEIGNNHEGSLSAAIKLIDKAKNSGADAVKFQTFKVENYISKTQPERYDRLKKFELSYSNFIKLKTYTKKKNMKFISTPLDLESANFLCKICDVLKIASGDNNYFKLIENVLKSHKPVILSTGMSNINDLKKTIQFITQIKNKSFLTDKFSILHCIASYPTELKDSNIITIKHLKKLFGLQVGLSDHCRSNLPALVSLGMGVRIFEKHITLSNNYSNFIDHKVALNPKDFANYVKQIKEAYETIGKKRNNIFYSEKKTFLNNRRSIYAAKFISYGEIINQKNTKTLRPFKKKSTDINNRNFFAKKNYKVNDII